MIFPSADQGSELPSKGEYLDERFWLDRSDGALIEHAWDGSTWANVDSLYQLEESLKEIDKPAVHRVEGDPIPLRVVRL